ncbi:helix-turn-helix domain-containing protein [Streptomyces sp. NPDC023723]|uniref:helix-turn-helix transcriptional regulator n=1 Tax=Streptomyces sp. NPDC023723 TaxID=3154323 RepID=UPI0033E44248
MRSSRGLSQGQLGTALGVPRQTINAIESERYTPSLDKRCQNSTDKASCGFSRTSAAVCASAATSGGRYVALYGRPGAQAGAGAPGRGAASGENRSHPR